jgi:pectate lyase
LAAYYDITAETATHVWIDHSKFNDGDRETQKNPSIWAAPYDLYANRVQPDDGALDIDAGAGIAASVILRYEGSLAGRC